MMSSFNQYVQSFWWSRRRRLCSLPRGRGIGPIWRMVGSRGLSVSVRMYSHSVSVRGLKIWRVKFRWVGGGGGRGSGAEILVWGGGSMARVGWESSGVGGGGFFASRGSRVIGCFLLDWQGLLVVDWWGSHGVGCFRFGYRSCRVTVVVVRSVIGWISGCLGWDRASTHSLALRLLRSIFLAVRVR